MLDFIRLVYMLRTMALPWAGSVADVRAVQERRMRKLLRHAVKGSPFYARRFAGIDIERCRLTDLPTTTKAEMMANFDDVVTDRRLKLADIQQFIGDPANLGRHYLGEYGISHTSGSQGQPALIVQDRRALMMSFVVQFARGTVIKKKGPFMHIERLWNPARMAVITQQPGFYPSGAAFAYLPAALKPFFKVLRLSVFDPIEETVAKLNAFKPEFVVGYTSSLEVIGREEEAGRLQLKASGCLKQVTNVSEPLPLMTAQRLERIFGVHVSDEYAMGECMALTSGCPHYAGSHLNADIAILEVVDRNYQPVAEGQPGAKVLLTNLYNTAQPFIRYEVDDVVTMSTAPCACGSPMPLIRSIEGRAKDAFWIVVDGDVRELPYYVFLAALHHELHLAEHQVLQTGVNTFVLRVAPQPGRELSVARLRHLVMQSVAVEGLADVVKFDVEIVEQIPRGPSGKVARMKNVFGPPADVVLIASSSRSRDGGAEGGRGEGQAAW